MRTTGWKWRWKLGTRCGMHHRFSLSLFTRFVHLGAPARKALGMKACKLHRTDVRCAAVCCAVWRASLWWGLHETMEREDLPRRLPRGVVCADPVTLKSRQDASHHLTLTHFYLIFDWKWNIIYTWFHEVAWPVPSWWPTTSDCLSPPGTESAQGSSQWGAGNAFF